MKKRRGVSFFESYFSLWTSKQFDPLSSDSKRRRAASLIVDVTKLSKNERMPSVGFLRSFEMGGFPSPRRIWVEIEAVSWVQHLVKNQAPCSSLFFFTFYQLNLFVMLALGRSLNKLTLVSAPRIASGKIHGTSTQ